MEFLFIFKRQFGESVHTAKRHCIDEGNSQFKDKNMPTIKLNRSNDLVNWLRHYQLYVDGQKIGAIAQGASMEFETTTGQHAVVAKIAWCSSPEIAFNLNQSQTKVLQVGGFRNSNWIMPLGLVLVVLGFLLHVFVNKEWTMLFALPLIALMVYYITIGRKEYLTLREVD